MSDARDAHDVQDPGARAFAEAARDALRASETLDPVRRARLAAARARALDAARAPPRRGWLLGAALAAGLAAWLLLPLRTLAPAPMPATVQASAEALELLTDELEPEFYRELELYEWLEQEAPRA